MSGRPAPGHVYSLRLLSPWPCQSCSMRSRAKAESDLPFITELLGSLPGGDILPSTQGVPGNRFTLLGLGALISDATLLINTTEEKERITE